MSVGVGELTAATNEMTGKVTAGQSEAWKLSTRRPLQISILEASMKVLLSPIKRLNLSSKSLPRVKGDMEITDKL